MDAIQGNVTGRKSGEAPTRADRRVASGAPASAGQRVAWPINEGAHRLGVSRSTIYKMAAASEIRLIKVGGRRLIPDAEITRLATGEGM